MITSEQISDKLSIAIANSNLTKFEICEKLGIKEIMLDNYVSGKSLPTVYIFANLCKTLDLNPNEILCISSNKKN